MRHERELEQAAGASGRVETVKIWDVERLAWVLEVAPAQVYRMIDRRKVTIVFKDDRLWTIPPRDVPEAAWDTGASEGCDRTLLKVWRGQRERQ